MRPKRRRSPSRSPSPQQTATASTSTAKLPAAPTPSRSHRHGGWTSSLNFLRLKGHKSQNNTRGSRSANTPPLPSPAAILLPSSSSSSSSALPPASIQSPRSLTKVQSAATVIWDGCTEALRVAKESSDWNPILKAALGGAVAVIDLGKKVNSNWREMEVLLTRIEGLQPILEMRMKTSRSSDNWSAGYVEKCAQTLEREVSKIKDMQTHGLIRRAMQGTSDGDRLLGVYRCIKDILDDLQYTVGLSTERDTGIIRQSVALKEMPISVTAPHNAAIDHTTVSRQSCTKDTRLAVIKPILRWISALDSAPVYWLTGPAGVGKTTIAQTICRYIISPTGEYEDEAGSNELKERRLVSYFCSHQLDSGESNRLVPTLCRRLAEHSSSYARELVLALERDSTLPNAELSAQLEGLLMKPWELSAAQREGLPLPIVVVDALDENQGGFRFLDLLLNAVDGRQFDGLRFLLTSRTDPNIAERCKHFPPGAVCRLQEVPKADVQHDITLYLQASLPKVKDELLRDLAERAGNLFIYASTVVKMTIKTRRSEQEKIIRTVLDTTSMDRLDDLYAGIVHHAIYHDDENIRRGRLRVLHTIVFREYRNNTSKELFYELSGAEPDVFSAVVEELHAVMYTAKDGSILTYHASFPDFILRTPSSFKSSLYLNPLCDEGLHHAHLTRHCYEIMAERLHFNMCNLESSFDLDKDVPDLKSRIEANIDPVLQYAVRYWMEHLYLSRPDEDTQESIPLCNIPLAFIDNLFLYWLEVANLLHGISMFPLFSKGGDWIRKHCPEHINIWKEMSRFRLIYSQMRLSSTLHIYISLLSLWKPESRIFRMWRPRFPHLPNVALDGQRNPTDVTWEEFGPQHSKGYTDHGTLGDGNELVGVPPWWLNRGTGWVLSDNGCRIMWLPHLMMREVGWSGVADEYLVQPVLDQISFNLQYLGRNWTRIYDPPSSQ